MSLPRRSDRVEFVAEDGRRGRLASGAEEAADAGGAEPADTSTNEDADWAKNLAFDSCATALASSSLAGAGRPVQERALGHAHCSVCTAWGRA
jgi:hypothetical protein